MRVKKIFSIIVFVIGILMLGGSYYIKNQVEQGKIQISSAEKSLSRGKSLFSLNPVTKQIGEGISRSADRKIDSANAEIQYYSNVAQGLLIGGIILMVLGAGMFFLGKRSKS